jgi:ketosteroid isomerase-like protein
MSSNDEEVTEQILQLQQNWETFHDSCDLSLIEPHIASDVVYLPPGGDPIVGKEAILDRYYRAYEGTLDLTYESQEIRSDGELAVNYHRVEGTHKDEETPINLKALDIFQRDSAGDWNLRWSIWNRSE